MQIRIQQFFFMPQWCLLWYKGQWELLDMVTKYSNKCIEKLMHFFACAPTINNTDISISAREASPGQTLPLAFKQTSTGTHSPRLPWGGDTPVPDCTVLLGSVSFMLAVLIAPEREGERKRTHQGAHSFPLPLLCLPRAARLGLGYSN